MIILPASLRAEARRASRRPVLWLCAGWFLCSGLLCALLVCGSLTSSVAAMVVSGTVWSAQLAAVPALFWGVVTGGEEDALQTARDSYLAGVSPVSDAWSRMAVAAVAPLLLWPLAVVAALLAACVGGIGGLPSGDAAKWAHAARRVVDSTLVACVLASACAVVSICVTYVMRSRTAAATLGLCGFLAYFGAVLLTMLSPVGKVLALLNPVGAAQAIASGRVIALAPWLRAPRVVGAVVLLGWLALLVPLALVRVGMGGSRTQPERRRDARQSFGGPSWRGRRWHGGASMPRCLRMPMTIVAVAGVAFAVGLVVPGALAKMSPDGFDGVYQRLSHQTDRDIINGLVRAVRCGAWSQADRLFGGSVRREAPRFVADARRLRTAHVAVSSYGSDGRIYRSVQFEVLTSTSDGVCVSGPMHLVAMSFRGGRWQISGIVPEEETWDPPPGSEDDQNQTSPVGP